jgi:hypothetical protein
MSSLTGGVCQSVFCCCDKIPEQNNLRKERLFWACGFRSFREGMAEQRGSPHGSQETEREREREREREKIPTLAGFLHLPLLFCLGF